MSLYKNGDVYRYEFEFNGERIQESSHNEQQTGRTMLHIPAALVVAVLIVAAILMPGRFGGKMSAWSPGAERCA